MEQDNYERSVKRANAAKIHTRVLDDGTVKDFCWRTWRKVGRKQWYWFPHTVENVYHGWNETGGPAHRIRHVEKFWLCMGWSTITQIKGGERGDD